MRSRNVALVSLGLLATVGFVASAASAAPMGGPGEQGPPSHAGPPEDLRPGDVVEDHGVAVVVPDRGIGVYSEGIMPGDEAPQQLTVNTFPDGTVVVESYGAESEPETEPDGGNPLDNGCTDGAYVLAGHKWYTGFTWYYNAAGSPSYLAADDIERAMRRGTTNVTQANNDCGFADNISAGQNFAGRTTTDIQVTEAGMCGTHDGKSVAKFGSLSNGTLATTCTWYYTSSTPYKAASNDVRFSTAFKWATSTVECVQHGAAYMIEDVMTHERGHNYGLAHVTEADHKWLTMSTNSQGPCDMSQATLGLGDYRALGVRY